MEDQVASKFVEALVKIGIDLKLEYKVEFSKDHYESVASFSDETTAGDWFDFLRSNGYSAKLIQITTSTVVLDET